MTAPIPTEPQRCGAPKADGSPCRSTMGLSPVNGRCIMHDPERAERRREMQANGGKQSGAQAKLANAAKHRKIPREPRTLDDMVKIAAWLTRAVLVGEIDSRTCESATKALRQFQLGEEKRALEEQVKALRAELATMKATAASGSRRT